MFSLLSVEVVRLLADKCFRGTIKNEKHVHSSRPLGIRRTCVDDTDPRSEDHKSTFTGLKGCVPGTSSVAPFGRVISFSPNNTAGLAQSAGPAFGEGNFRTQPSRSVSWFILFQQVRC